MLNKYLQRIDKVIFFVLPFFLIILLSSYIYIQEIKQKNSLYFQHNDQINKLVELNSYINDFINQKIELVVFDDIAMKMNSFETILQSLIEDGKLNQLDVGYINKLSNIEKIYSNKRLQIERLKSRKAFAYNALTYIFDNRDLGYLELSDDKKRKIDLIKLKFSNLSLGLDNLSQIQYEIDLLQNLQYEDKYIENFIKLSNALLSYYPQINLAMHRLNNIDIYSSLISVKEYLINISENEQRNSYYIIDAKFIVILLFTFLILFGAWRLYKTRKDLIGFKLAVENSDNVVVMTDVNQKIIFVNDKFSKVTGYNKSEAIGLKPSVLKSGHQDDLFYKDMAKTIYSGKKWQGRFINKKKNGDIFYEDATITPIVIDGKIESYLAIKLDVTQLVNYSNELKELNDNLEAKVEDKISLIRQKDALIQQQSRLAALGEMIGNIAHQWRQPLSSITIGASGLKYKHELEILELDDNFDKDLDNIISGAEYLSQTIEDFRNFAKVDKNKKTFDINESIKKTYKIVENLYKVNSINVEFNLCEEMFYNGLQSQLSQVLINILNNAKDALISNNSNRDSRKIVVCTNANESNYMIKISDNAGGIPQDIVSKIFDPYFTTKHQSQGTGIGLFMTHEIIKNHFGGTIEVKNESMMIDGKEYMGAVFYVYFPKVMNISEDDKE
jgi:PAS domain S-box-containing protein